MNDAETVAWLRDRALITDLLFQFAEALDAKDWERYAGLYTDDGVLELPWGEVVTKDRLVQSTSHNLGRFESTHHMSTNQRVFPAGDTATSSSYLQATHVYPADQHRENWVAGARYDCTYRLVDGTWKFVRVRLTSFWQTGEPPQLG